MNCWAYLKNKCDVYNYAADNTVDVCNRDVTAVMGYIIIKLRQVGNEMLEWFHINFMQTNPSKFQYIVFSKTPEKTSIVFKCWCNFTATEVC